MSDTRDLLDATPQTPAEFQKHAIAFVRIAAECLHAEHGYAELTRDLARALMPLLISPMTASSWDEWAMQRAKRVMGEPRMETNGSYLSQLQACIHMALIEAMRFALVPEGWKLVPMKADAKMLSCSHDFGWHGNIDGDHACEEEKGQELWEAMVAVSPTYGDKS